MKKLNFAGILISSVSVLMLTSVSSEVEAPKNTRTFEIAPYVFFRDEKAPMIGWRYDKSYKPEEPASITLFDGSRAVQRIQGSSDGVVYTATLPLPACGSGTVWSYQVTGATAPVALKEIPCAGSSRPTRFSFIADAQEGPEFLQEIAAEIKIFQPSAILSDGDLVQTGNSLSDWDAYFQALESVTGSIPTIAAIGNHEYRSTPHDNYWQNFFKLSAHDAHYSVYLGDAHLIVLNSNMSDDPALVESQLPWLESELAKPAAWKLVMFHHPPYSSGIFNGPLAPKKEFEKLQQFYVPLFEKYRADVILTGHTHIFEHSLKDGIHYLVAGPAGGKMGVYGNSNSYSLKTAYERTVTHFEVSSSHLRAVTLTIKGKIIDDLQLNK